MYEIKLSTALNVMIFAFDANGDAVLGKVDGDWTKIISKNGGNFLAMTVTITEAQNGWYSLTLSAGHTDTLGVLSMSFTAPGVKQVNLQYRVESQIVQDIVAGQTYPAGAIQFTYTMTNSLNSLPLPDVNIWISTDNPATNIVWSGFTDNFGVARDVNGNLPALDPGVYFFWRNKSSFIFIDPDQETVS